MARSRLIGLAATVLTLPLLIVAAPSGAAAAPDPAPPGDMIAGAKTGARMVVDGTTYEMPATYTPKAAAKARSAAPTPPVGTVRQWFASDDNTGWYLKDFTLRGVGGKIEVWVANDLAFPAGDCRPASSVTITDANVARMISEFDTNMYPKETAAFSTPPDRDGTASQVPRDFTGDGDNTVALVDNVRDSNFYDFPANTTYTAGFFSGALNEATDRNVMTIDAFDWAHRTGANPPDEPTSDPCTSRPARPNSYEGTFAHEWQHLQMYYTDSFEGNWINEGLSDYAMYLTGYSDSLKTVHEKGWDSHLICQQGWATVQTPANPNVRDCGGPENSLTLWGEGNTGGDVLADYGNAYAFMLYLADRFGADILTRLHNDAKRGLESVTAQLATEGQNDLYRVIHDYQSMTLLDGIVGESRHGVVIGVPKKRVTAANLRSSVNFANPDSHATPGAAPNGADYLAPRDAAGKELRGRDLRSLSFEGVRSLPPAPLQWTVVSDDADRPGNPVVWSGNRNNLDATAVAKVTVPATDPVLRFLAKYGAETGYDYAYVMVSTDGGATYTPIAGDKTTQAPLGPGLNGTTTGFEPHTFDLAAYAGQEILVNFRYVSDGGVNEGGLKLDDIAVGGTAVSDGSSLDPFDSVTEVRPIAIDSWNVRLIGYDGKRSVALYAEVDDKFAFSLNRLQLALLAPFPKVAAIVAVDDPGEQVQQYAPYTLKINGVTQPG
ncbi:choice-of-anchor J domain-containing protein [Nonomuraea sp. NPDC059023]|uniref:choice-of-anchor J domain-containing protein n=1 Tax=Nonomuraea sp. NPDC059023 TaxID=3346706 RepID=UPI00369B8F82